MLRRRKLGNTNMADDSREPVDALSVVGAIILGLLVLGLAYIHEAAGECVRNAVSLADPNSIFAILDPPTRSHRIIVGTVGAGVLYAILFGLHRGFHLFGRPWLDGLFVIAGAILAGLIPLDLCHRL